MEVILVDSRVRVTYADENYDSRPTVERFPKDMTFAQFKKEVIAPLTRHMGEIQLRTWKGDPVKEHVTLGLYEEVVGDVAIKYGFPQDSKQNGYHSNYTGSLPTKVTPQKLNNHRREYSPARKPPPVPVP